MLKFFINDSEPLNWFTIDYINTDGFFSLKKSVTMDELPILLDTISISDLDNLLKLVDDYIKLNQFRKRDEKVFHELYDYLYGVRYPQK